MRLLDSCDTFKRYMRAILCSLPLILISVVVYASEGGEGEHGVSMEMWKDFGFRVLNTAILVGFLYWLMANKIKDFFSGRRKDIKQALADAEQAKAVAEQKFREYETKLTKATDEISGIVDMIKAQGLAERDKILDDAQKAAEKMKEDTKTRMEQELTNAQSQLRQEAVQLSVQMAEEILKRSITPADHENMVKDYLDKVVIKH